MSVPERPVLSYLEGMLKRRLRNSGVVVWYDKEGAFAGLVPRVQVTLDGRTHDLDRVLMDSAQTLVGLHAPEEDAQAIRNIVYALDEVAKGNTRVTK